MKHIVTILFLVLPFLTLAQQEVCKLDTFVQDVYQGGNLSSQTFEISTYPDDTTIVVNGFSPFQGSWNLTGRRTITLDADGNFRRTISEKLQAGTWVPTFETVTERDQLSRVISFEQNIYDQAQQEWIPRSRSKTTYQGIQTLGSSLQEVWNPSSQNWDFSSQSIREYDGNLLILTSSVIQFSGGGYYGTRSFRDYSVDGKLISKREQISQGPFFPTVSDWGLSSVEEYVYDNAGNYQVFISSPASGDTTLLEPKEREEHQVNSLGQVTSVEYSRYLSINSTYQRTRIDTLEYAGNGKNARTLTWVYQGDSPLYASSESIWEYNDEGQLTLVLRSDYRPGFDELVPRSKDEIEYNEQGYATLERRQTWNEAIADWELWVLTSRTYLCGDNPVQNPAENALKIFPNPATDKVYLFVNLNREQSYQVKLSDLSGREIYRSEGIWDGLAVMVPFPDEMISGLYIVQLSTEGGLYSGKVTVE